ncbi:MAG: hypothetical protein IKG79_04885 [Neisseriaceae bacterium]|nr:hypothetical protein [Neisseriaceae bacterium]
MPNPVIAMVLAVFYFTYKQSFSKAECLCSYLPVLQVFRSGSLKTTIAVNGYAIYGYVIASRDKITAWQSPTLTPFRQPENSV